MWLGDFGRDSIYKCARMVKKKVDSKECETEYFDFYERRGHQYDGSCHCCNLGYQQNTAKYENLYRLEEVKIPIFSDGKEITQQIKEEHEFCQQICDEDPECTAFEYDHRNPGKEENCKTFNEIGITGDGADHRSCFMK